MKKFGERGGRVVQVRLMREERRGKGAGDIFVIISSAFAVVLIIGLLGSISAHKSGTPAGTAGDALVSRTDKTSSSFSARPSIRSPPPVSFSSQSCISCTLSMPLATGFTLSKCVCSSLSPCKSMTNLVAVENHGRWKNYEVSTPWCASLYALSSPLFLRDMKC